ncbi:unnamed protein product [Aspergillus oryzae]|nr:unnamed protein product [Aspergillus oryzae]
MDDIGCQKKGIECSGLGRFRFSTGIATRGKLKGCAIPATVPPQSHCNNQSPTGAPTPQKIRWKDDGPNRNKRKPRTAATKASTYPTVQEVKDRQAWLDSESQSKSAVPRASETLIAPDALGEKPRVGSVRYFEGTTTQQDQVEWQECSGSYNNDGGKGCDYWSSRAPDLCSTIIPWIPSLGPEDRMFQFLGQPLLNETQGMNALGFHPSHYLDWTDYELPPESRHNRVLWVVRQAFIEASQIYILRATTNHDVWDRLESLKQLVSRVDPDEQGAHALVWVCFIAAADSTDPEHRRFFTERMNQVFAKTKFQNIVAAVRTLPEIWAQQGSGRWTSNLIQLTPTLIM